MKGAVAALLLAGCGGAALPQGDMAPCAPRDDGGVLIDTTSGDLPCEVAAVLKDKCQPCHQIPTMNHAPFPLLSFENTHAPYGKSGRVRWQRMAEVILPDEVPHMPPRSKPQPTDDQLATLQAWFAACAPPVPEGTGCDIENIGH